MVTALEVVYFNTKTKRLQDYTIIDRFYTVSAKPGKLLVTVHFYSMVREPASIRACQLQHLHISYNHIQGTSKVSLEYSQHGVFSAKIALVYELNAPGCDCSALKDSLPHRFWSQLEGSRCVAGAKAGLSNGTRQHARREEVWQKG